MPTPEQEQQIIERLTTSGGDEFEAMEQAERHARQIISQVCTCTVEVAAEHLQSLRDRALLDVELTPPGGPIPAGENIPRARFKWVRSPAP